MTEPDGFTRIFHPTDLSPASDVAFVHALKLALSGPTHLTIFHFAHKGEEEDDAHEFPRVRDTLTQWKLLPPNARREDVGPALGLYVRKVLVGGDDPIEAIAGFITRHPPDVIVLATHQHGGIARWLHREIALPVVREAALPALFVPPDTRGFVEAATGNLQLRRILVPLDRHPHPQGVIDLLPSFVRAFYSGPLVVDLLHVGTSATIPRLRIPDIDQWIWQTDIVAGDVVETILKKAETTSADLIVLATQGRAGFLDAIRGSTTERIVRGARCPVLAVPTGARATGRTV